MSLGNNIAVYPDVSVILKRSSPPEGAKGNAVKDPAQGLSKRLCEIAFNGDLKVLRVAQDDTNAEKIKNWVNIYIITCPYVLMSKERLYVFMFFCLNNL